MNAKIVAIAIFLLQVFTLRAQDFPNIVPENRTYVNGIGAIQLLPEDAQIGLPIMVLNGEKRLNLAFDDLNGDDKYLKYTLIHCTHDWQFDNLSQIEYLDGFMEDEISEQSYSFNTLVSYTHYELTFPTDFLRITKSGNYILFVYDDTPDNPVFTRRFMVVEPQQVGISGVVKQASNVNQMFTMQEVDFTVHGGGYTISNPAMYLHANIVQNGRWDNAIIGLKYRSGKPGEYSFDYDNGENAFNGGDDFRTFDSKSLRYNANNVVGLGFENHTNTVYLLEDQARPYGAYESNATLSGYYYIKNEDFSARNSEDWVETFFTLRADFNIPDGDLYLFGALTDWQLLPEAKLHQNPKTGLWETHLPLKQGYYNYQYVFVKKGSNTIDETFIEGSHWETPNLYTVLIYLQDEGSIYDKLVGATVLKINQ